MAVTAPPVTRWMAAATSMDGIASPFFTRVMNDGSLPTWLASHVAVFPFCRSQSASVMPQKCMSYIVYVKHDCVWRGVAFAGWLAKLRHAPVPKPKRVRRPNFLRQWRKYRGLSLAAVGAEIGMDGTNLGRIEKGEVPYSQDLLEMLADLYGCEVSDLLIRDPSDAQGIWSLWEQAKPAEREQIVRVAKALVADAPSGTSTPRDPQSPERSRQTSAKSRTRKAS